MYLQKQQQTFCQIIIGFFIKNVDLLQEGFHLRISRILFWKASIKVYCISPYFIPMFMINEFFHCREKIIQKMQQLNYSAKEIKNRLKLINARTQVYNQENRS